MPPEFLRAEARYGVSVFADERYSGVTSHMRLVESFGAMSYGSSRCEFVIARCRSAR